MHCAVHTLKALQSVRPTKIWCVLRDNVEDAIGKLQSFLDDAALAVQPIEEDPVKKKKLLKQCVAPGKRWQTNCCPVYKGCGQSVHGEDPMQVCARRQKKANEKRLEAKKMKSQKKSDRRGKIDY